MFVIIHFIIIQNCGVKFRADVPGRVFLGSIGPFSDDNLGAYSIGGYAESFNSFRICRICMGTKANRQTKATLLLYILELVNTTGRVCTNNLSRQLFKVENNNNNSFGNKSWITCISERL